MKRFLSVILVCLILSACKHELESPSWDLELITPLVHTKMNIKNLLTDTNLNVSENEEGFINLIYQEKFIDLNIDTLIKIDAIADEQTHTLDSASFADVVIADTATIGETITEIPLGTILLPDGSTNTIPAIPNVANSDTINIDASEYFETMTLHSGILTIEIMNGYPTDISNLSLKLINATNQNIVATFSFPLIPAGGIVSDSISIAGQTIDENLYAILENMDINASNGPVLINYADAIITTITISQIGITEATAIFPEQQLTETLKEHTFSLGSAEIKELGIKEGTVKINVLSTLPNGKMVYSIPSLKKNGIPFTTGDMIIPQAISTELTTFDFDFTGYILDLTGQEGRIGGDTVNTIYTESYTFIDYTGTLETINNTDSFYSFVDFYFIPEYAKGYLGKDTIEIGSEEKDLNVFNKISASNFELEEVDLQININNYIGADFQINLLELKGKNNKTNEEVILVNNEIIDITRATLSNNTLPINHTNSQIIIPAEEFISILPNKVISDANIYLNPYGPSNNEDFLYPEFPIEANIEINIPLSMIAEDLLFIDTTDVNLPNSNEYSIEKIYLKLENGLPFEANIELILLDENNLIIDTLLNNTTITAAQVDANNIVVNSTSNTIEIDYTDFQSVKKMISISSFTTKPINQFIDIYPNYEIDITLSAKINKKIGE